LPTIAYIGLILGIFFVCVVWALVVFRAVDRYRIDRIVRSLNIQSTAESFSKETVLGLPPVAQRYFLHTVKPGTPLAASVQLRISGDIKVDRGEKSTWMPLKAVQILTPQKGFVWKASVRKGVIYFSEVDYYWKGTGRVALRFLGLLPLLAARGKDSAKSAAGRLVMESVLLPTGLLPHQGVVWEDVNHEHVRAACTVDDEELEMTLAVDASGRLREVVMQRWGEVGDKRGYDYIPFGIVVHEERIFGGYTIPSSMSAGWWYGTDRYVESIRWIIEEAQFK
jgi:hypothetical protein